MEVLKPQDVVVVLKLCALSVPGTELAIERNPSIAALATDLGMSASEIHAAMRRAKTSRLLSVAITVRASNAARGQRDTGSTPRGRPPLGGQPNRTAIIEFLVHGLKYVFPPTRGELTRGIPTSYAAPPMNELIPPGDEPIPVWPWAKGSVRGIAFEPLYRSVPVAVQSDRRLYELLALADALRDGRARERKIAEEQLRRLL